MSVRVGSVKRMASTKFATPVETTEVRKLRAEVAVRAKQIEACRIKLQKLQEEAEPTLSSQAFKVFGQGLKTESEITKTIVPEIAPGRVTGAKKSLYGAEVPHLDSVSDVSGREESTTSHRSEGNPEYVNGVEVYVIEEIVSEEVEEVEVDEDGNIVRTEVRTVPQTTLPEVDSPSGKSAQSVQTVESLKLEGETNSSTGELNRVSELIVKFKKMEEELKALEQQTAAQKRMNMQRSEEERLNKERREREEKIEELKRKRAEQELLLAKKAAEVKENFAKKWAYGEPRKQELLVTYLKDLCGEYDAQIATLNLEIMKVGGFH